MGNDQLLVSAGNVDLLSEI